MNSHRTKQHILIVLILFCGWICNTSSGGSNNKTLTHGSITTIPPEVTSPSEKGYEDDDDTKHYSQRTKAAAVAVGAVVACSLALGLLLFWKRETVKRSVQKFRKRFQGPVHTYGNVEDNNDGFIDDSPFTIDLEGDDDRVVQMDDFDADEDPIYIDQRLQKGDNDFGEDTEDGYEYDDDLGLGD